jgi:hypothetical protein
MAIHVVNVRYLEAKTLSVRYNANKLAVVNSLKEKRAYVPYNSNKNVKVNP